MEAWVSDYEAERQGFDQQRHEQFLAAVKNAHLLVDHKMDGYAIDEVSKAYLLADDRDAFRNEKWVNDLIKETAGAADQNESAALWLKAMRMYQDLTVIEPGSAAWKNKLKVVATRVGMLFIYTPERFKKLQELEEKDYDSADAVMSASTRPSVAKAATTQPAIASIASPTTEPSDDDSILATDWHDRMRGIQFDMLYSAGAGG